MRRFSLPSRSRRRLLTRGSIVALMLGVACKGAEKERIPSEAGPGDIGGTVVVASPSDAETLLPGLIAGNMDRAVTDLLYDHLADIGQTLNTVGDKDFEPHLAERWEWSKDSLSIVFHLNPHAKWHDGQPVRASDVRYSLRMMQDPAFASPAASLIGNVDSVSVRDSLTPVVWFKRRVPEQFYDFVYQVAIVPEHVLSNTPPAQLKTADIGRKGIGSGRFRLAKWEPGTRLEVIADTGNYRGRPKLDRIIFSIAPDFTAAVTRFFTGEADVFENLRAENLERFATDTLHRTQRLPSLGFSYLAFNAIDPKAPAHPHPVLGERAVRRALSMAVDRRAMLRNVFDTIGQFAYGPFPRAVPGADTTVPQLAYDTVRAKMLLDSAGWIVGGDGVRVKAGRRLAFSITTPNSSASRKSYSVLLQDAFRRIGADVKIDESDYNTYLQKITSHNFDTEMANFSTDPSVSGFKQIWSTAGIGKDGSNFYSYSNPVVDALLDSATSAFDPARARTYSRRAFEAIIEDAPGIWLYEPPTLAGIDKRIHMKNLRADAYFSGMADWWIPINERNARDRIGLRTAP